MKNAINVIEPYRWNGMWVFDDREVGLKREPFVSGADLLCDQLATVNGEPFDRFTLIFSEHEFPGHQLHLRLKRVEKVGHTYVTDSKQEAWLCPALLLYFNKPPKHIYAQAKHHVKFNQHKRRHPWHQYQNFSTTRPWPGA